MAFELLIISNILLIFGVLIDQSRNITKNKPEVLVMITGFVLIGRFLEWVAIFWLGINETGLIVEWMIGLCIFDVPIETLYFYATFSYFLMMIYFRFIKESIEDKILSPFKVYSK